MAQSDLDVVFAALSDGSTLHAMLRDALPHAVAPFASGEAPHGFQEQLLAAAREEITKATAAAQHAVAAAEEAGRAKQAAIKEAEADEAAAVKKVDGAKAAEEACRAENDEHAGKVARADALHAATTKATAATLEAQAELEKERAALRALVERPEAQAVVEFLEGQRAEKALVVSVPAAFSLDKDARSEFDAIVVEEAFRLITCRAEKVDAELAESAADAAAAEAERLGTWAILDVARDEAAEAERRLAAAGKARAEAEDMRKAAAQATEARRAEATELTTAENTAQLKVTKLTTAENTLQRLMRGEAAAAAMVVDDEHPSFAPNAEGPKGADGGVVMEEGAMAAAGA